ncbi:MAG: ZIP family metal transporter [Candidatus Limnocylindrales bacterium]
MTFGQTVLLSAFAGATIFLGLPVGRMRVSPRVQVMLTAAAAGVVLFLLWDILSHAVEPLEAALEAAQAGTGTALDAAVDAVALAGSLAVGLMSIVLVNRRLRGTRGEMDLRQIAMGTAVGLGLHNFSEGLAIGQSSATGATSLALLLVIGFALHNATEGFGIAAPLASGPQPSWSFLITAGIVGGGPTFLGGVVGYTFVSPLVSIIFLGVAAGALIHVFNEMVSVSRRFADPIAANLALILGLIIALATDIILTLAGA